MKVLDCTLRDGGYVNNWRFGEQRINNIIKLLEEVGVDIVELGFIRDFEPDSNSSNIASIDNLNKKLKPNSKVIYSAMLEAFDPYPLEKLPKHTPGGVDLIRICIWKRKLSEHLDYCKRVLEKGYKISIQPSRVEQYNDEEFLYMIEKVNELTPFSVYVVDTWGTQSSQQIKKYIELADEHLLKGTILGYHGHNNKMQALDCVNTILNMSTQHEISIDSSLMGMGRGAGNLNTELLLQLLNEKYGKEYDLDKAIYACSEEILPIYKNTPWGYSLYYFLSALYGCNPNYATYFQEKDYGLQCFKKFLESLSDVEKIAFSSDFTENKLAVMEK